MIGTELGSYRIAESLGKGGMAEVYVGEHLMLGRRAAIKVLRHRYNADEAVRTRFVREGRAVAELRHPSIVGVYDFGTTDDGRPFIVLELVHGDSLRTRIKDGSLSLAQALTFSHQISSALTVAHEHGVVHRDLKPDNVLIAADPEVDLGERAKVLDFGVAKHLITTDGAEITKTGVLLGTPAYMSPEQCRGDRDVGPRSDIYSLGVVMYRMVTNALPFDAVNTDEVLDAHLNVAPTPPTAHNADLPIAMSELIMRCLHKDPAQRFADMRELAQALAMTRRIVGADGDSRAAPTPPGTHAPAPQPAGALPLPAPDTEPSLRLSLPDVPARPRAALPDAPSAELAVPRSRGPRWVAAGAVAAGAAIVLVLALGGGDDGAPAAPAITAPRGDAKPVERAAPAATPVPAAAPAPAPTSMTPPDAAPVAARADASPPPAKPAPREAKPPPPPPPKSKPKPKPKPKPGKPEPEPDRESFEKPVL